MAVSDELGLYAHPRRAIFANGQRSLIDAVTKLADDEQVTEIVVGLPLSLSGAHSGQTERARRLAAALRQRLSIPVIEWDERLSSVEAARRVPGAKHRSGELDSEAASIILQAVLDARRGMMAR